MKLQTPDDGVALLIHPAELDAVLQSCMLAYSYPYDGMLHTLHLPTAIKLIRISPAPLAQAVHRNPDELGYADAVVLPKDADHRGISGDVNFYTTASPHAAIQIQQASFVPLGGTAEKDRRVFSKVQWLPSHPDGVLASQGIQLGQEHRDKVRLLERIATFYLRKFHHEVPADSPARSEFPNNRYLEYARYVTEIVVNGRHKWVRPEWLHDTAEDIDRLAKPYLAMPAVEIMQLVGKQMPRVFGGETTMLEQFRQNDILDRYYAGGFGL